MRETFASRQHPRRETFACMMSQAGRSDRYLWTHCFSMSNSCPIFLGSGSVLIGLGNGLEPIRLQAITRANGNSPPAPPSPRCIYSNHKVTCCKLLVLPEEMGPKLLRSLCLTHHLLQHTQYIYEFMSFSWQLQSLKRWRLKHWQRWGSR